MSGNSGGNQKFQNGYQRNAYRKANVVRAVSRVIFVPSVTAGSVQCVRNSKIAAQIS
jgi:hypothetical protein